MESKQVESKSVRSRETLALRATAPIAAQFEDCLQCLYRLCTALRAHHPASNEVFVIAEDGMARLQTWGDDSGASSRCLDYSLRRSPQLRRVTLDHLEELHAVLLDGLEQLPMKYAELSLDDLSIRDSDVAAGSEELELPEDEDSDSSPEKRLEDMADIVSCLVELLPVLGDPAEETGTEGKLKLLERESIDVQVAMSMFPTAPRFLIERLVEANSRRKQRLRQSKLELEQSEAHRDGERDAISAQKPKQTRPVRRGRLWSRFRSEIESTAPSTIESTFSGRQNTLDNDSITGTSIAETNKIISPTVVLKPPPPPVRLGPDVSFKCSFCCFNLPLGMTDMTTEDWETHLYHDLEPYLCTALQCTNGHKTFGEKKRWFQHEIACHHSRPVWVCGSPSCKRDFDEEGLFENHLRSAHAEFLTKEKLAIILDSCRRVSLNPLLRPVCPICGSLCSDLHDYSEHVGGHLEQFALTAIYYGDLSESDDGGDSGPDELLLDEYVEDQVGRFGKMPENHDNIKQAAWAAKLNAEDEDEEKRECSAKTDTMNTSDLADDEDEKRPRNERGLWEDRIETFLNKHHPDGNEGPKGSMEETQVLSNRPSRISEFVGRSEDLSRMHEALSLAGQICVLSGQGGVGKTAAATEYSYRFQKEYSYIFWVEAETAGGCADKFALIAAGLELPEAKKVDQTGLIILVKEFLSKAERRWLLIFDNVEEWISISKYIPRNFSKTLGSILITTRYDGLLTRPSRNYHKIWLGALSLHDGTALLLQSMNPRSVKKVVREYDSAQRELAAKATKLVGSLPLAISMIAGYVRVSKCDLEEFLDTWEELQSRTQKTKGDADATIDSLWDIGIGELPMKARNLLDIISFLDPDTIQKDLLVGDHPEPFLEFLNSTERTRYRRMIDQLSGRKLITVKEIDGEEVYSVHRLLQEKIITEMDHAHLTDSFQGALTLVRRRYPTASAIQVPEPEKWTNCNKYMRHVFSLHRALKDTNRVVPSLQLAELFYDAGFHIWEQQTTAYDGLSFLKTAEEILDTINHDQFGKIRADIHCIVGILNNGLGCRERGESLRRQRAALKIREKIYSEVSPSDKDSDVLLANAANDLGICLLNQKSFEEAKPIFENCFGRYCEWGTEEEIPFEYSKYYHNIAVILMWEGKLEDSIRSLRKATKLAGTYSAKMWQYWQTKFTLASVLLQAGDVQAALDEHLEILAARYELYGKHDQSTIASTYATGAMYYHLGDVPTAIEYIEECVECAKTSKWSEEALGRARFFLAKLYRIQGDKEEDAKVLEREALDVLDKYSEYVAESVRRTEDKMLMFDDLQPTCDGKFTGVGLLDCLKS